jgi:hypothetical protein
MRPCFRLARDNFEGYVLRCGASSFGTILRNDSGLWRYYASRRRSHARIILSGRGMGLKTERRKNSGRPPWPECCTWLILHPCRVHPGSRIRTVCYPLAIPPGAEPSVDSGLVGPYDGVTLQSCL